MAKHKNSNTTEQSNRNVVHTDGLLSPVSKDRATEAAIKPVASDPIIPDVLNEDLSELLDKKTEELSEANKIAIEQEIRKYVVGPRPGGYKTLGYACTEDKRPWVDRLLILMGRVSPEGIPQPHWDQFIKVPQANYEDWARKHLSPRSEVSRYNTLKD